MIKLIKKNKNVDKFNSMLRLKYIYIYMYLIFTMYTNSQN